MRTDRRESVGRSVGLTRILFVAPAALYQERQRIARLDSHSSGNTTGVDPRTVRYLYHDSLLAFCGLLRENKAGKKTF